MFEDFSLSANVAVGCEFKTSTATEGVCGYPTRNGIIFVTGVSGCVHTEPDINDSLCYHVPNEYHNIFNS
jgi:hypothetical protein